MGEFTQSFLAGAQLYDMAMQRSERLANLRAQQSMRALQDRRIAQEMQFAAAEHEQKVKEWQDQIQFQADLTKAVGAMQADMEPSVVGQGDETIAAMTGLPARIRMPGMSQSDAALKHLLPVISKHSPKDVMPFMANVARLKDDEAKAALAPIEKRSTEALATMREAEASYYKARANQPFGPLTTTVTAKDIAGYKAALASGDEVGIKAYAEKLLGGTRRQSIRLLEMKWRNLNADYIKTAKRLQELRSKAKLSKDEKQELDTTFAHWKALRLQQREIEDELLPTPSDQIFTPPPTEDEEDVSDFPPADRVREFDFRTGKLLP